MLITIQYLRALAVLMVLVVHTYGWGGAQGVDIFFIISGYIMMHIMYAKPRGALEFFIARFLRVAPIYYIATAVALFIGHSNDPSIEHIIHSLLFLKLKWSSPVLSIGWTLEYEFIFYFLCSVSLIFKIKQKYRTYVIIFLLIGLSIVLDYILFPQKAYGHFLEFIYGIALFSLLRKIRTLEYKLPVPLLFLCSFVALISLFCIQDVFYADGYLYLRFIGYGIPALFLCASFILLEKYIPEVKFLAMLGNASYSIYVSHTISLYLYYKIFDVSRYYSFLSDTLSLFLALLIGILMHFYIEKPIGKLFVAKNITDKLLGLWLVNKIAK